jgi:hypothetical protein
MESYPIWAYLIPATLIFATGMMVWIYLRKDRKHPAEAGNIPVFSEACGGIIGWITYRGPFIRVSVYEDFLVVSCNKPYALKFYEISQLEPCTFFYKKGFRIRHENPAFPKRLEVWISNREAFAAAVKL